ncbi:hypothetical protein [Streptomyces sp. C36]|uniref:hypothetical protein n=1 Tax=Streptomyces sp. C36 TaxID=3237122 RepID=UPI0034C6455B
MTDDHPLRAALALLVLGLAGPATVLHQQVGKPFGAPEGPVLAAPDVTAPDER